MAEEMYDQMLFEAQGLPPMDEVWGGTKNSGKWAPDIRGATATGRLSSG